MQTTIPRLSSNFLPFKCQFMSARTPVQPDYKRLPELPLEVWLEIFQFATYVHQCASIQPLDPFAIRHVTGNAMGPNSPALALRTKLSLVLVSRSWREAALELLYRHFVIRSPSRARMLLNVLEKSTTDGKPGYGQWTRHIEISTYMRGSEDIRYLQTIFHIFRRCPSLRVLSGTWVHKLPDEFLHAISTQYGNTLSGLYWNERGPSTPEWHVTNATPGFLATFNNLRVLDLRHFIGNEPTKPTPHISRPTLHRVEILVLSTHPRSLSHATFLALPALRKLVLRTPSFNVYTEQLLVAFLDEHGPSLIEIDLPPPSFDSDVDTDVLPTRNPATHVNPDIFLKPGRCPNLESFAFPVTSPPLYPHGHAKLRRIGLRGVRVDGLYPDKPSTIKSHLTEITAERYPELQLVQTVGFLVEAETDCLAKDIFIWWVERFEKEGIDFLDGEGVLWAYTDPVDPPEDNPSPQKPTSDKGVSCEDQKRVSDKPTKPPM